MTIHTPKALIYDRSYGEFRSESRKEDMYRKIMSRDSYTAVLAWNNLLVAVTDNHITATSWEEDVTVVDTWVDVHSTFRPYIPIGFVKTYPYCKDVNVAPYLLFMDQEGDVCMELGELKNLPEAVYTKDVSLYKQLIQTDYTAIYKTESGVKYI